MVSYSKITFKRHFSNVLPDLTVQKLSLILQLSSPVPFLLHLLRPFQCSSLSCNLPIKRHVGAHSAPAPKDIIRSLVVYAYNIFACTPYGSAAPQWLQNWYFLVDWSLCIGMKTRKGSFAHALQSKSLLGSDATAKTDSRLKLNTSKMSACFLRIRFRQMSTTFGTKWENSMVVSLHSVGLLTFLYLSQLYTNNKLPLYLKEERKVRWPLSSSISFDIRWHRKETECYCQGTNKGSFCHGSISTLLDRITLIAVSVKFNECT